MSDAMLQNLVPQFGRIGLPLRVLNGPIRNGNRQIFQMDILSFPDSEYFRLWPGHRENQIQVSADDLGFRQLVLRVHEPRRRFEERISKGDASRNSAEHTALRRGGRVIGDDARSWILELWTPGEERRYLCGFDESSLFIAQVARGSTVADAHEALKPAEVIAAEAESPGRVLRQGEWFFLPLVREDEAALGFVLRHQPESFRRNEPVEEARRPHLAEEVVHRKVPIHDRGVESTLEIVYARGWVTHSDHRPLFLDGWRRVVRNAELRTDPSGGNKWIDQAPGYISI
jgi:hypothetical protein